MKDWCVIFNDYGEMKDELVLYYNFLVILCVLFIFKNRCVRDYLRLEIFNMLVDLSICFELSMYKSMLYFIFIFK